jgi:glycine/D-amino acid oxidase-like deaminating enzyme
VHPLLVIGGGIGGLATALAAGKAGREVLVIEQSPAFAEIGAGLPLAPNATRMLDRLGILGPVLETATFPRNLIMMDAVTGRPITRLDLGASSRWRIRLSAKMHARVSCCNPAPGSRSASSSHTFAQQVASFKLPERLEIMESAEEHRIRR